MKGGFAAVATVVVRVYAGEKLGALPHTAASPQVALVHPKGKRAESARVVVEPGTLEKENLQNNMTRALLEEALALAAAEWPD